MTIAQSLEESQIDRANEFITKSLTRFYNHLLSYGKEAPIPVLDKYRNPNPLMFFKVYTDTEILLTHYLINEGLINCVMEEVACLVSKLSL